MKPLPQFLLLTFALFFGGFALVGLLMFVGSPGYLVVFFQIAMAWTPTMAFAITHRKIDPDRSFWRYVADRFSTGIRLVPLLASILIPVLVTVIVWAGYSSFYNKPPLELLVKMSAVPVLVMFADSLVRGPLGEELGWRGYLLEELNKRFSLLRSSLIVGVLWGIWHLPLWFISGFQGVDLLLYILFFMLGLVSFSVIIGFIYPGRGGNLLYAIILHQMLNFAGRLIEIDELTVLGASSIAYLLIAFILALRMSRRPAVDPV